METEETDRPTDRQTDYMSGVRETDGDRRDRPTDRQTDYTSGVRETDGVRRDRQTDEGTGGRRKRLTLTRSVVRESSRRVSDKSRRCRTYGPSCPNVQTPIPIRLYLPRDAIVTWAIKGKGRRELKEKRRKLTERRVSAENRLIEATLDAFSPPSHLPRPLPCPPSLPPSFPPLFMKSTGDDIWYLSISIIHYIHLFLRLS